MEAGISGALTTSQAETGLREMPGPWQRDSLQLGAAEMGARRWTLGVQILIWFFLGALPLSTGEREEQVFRGVGTFSLGRGFRLCVFCKTLVVVGAYS